MPSATIDMHKFLGSLNKAMNAKFYRREGRILLEQQELPYLSLNRPSFEVAGINEQEAEQAIQLAVPAASTLAHRRARPLRPRLLPLLSRGYAASAG